MLLNKFFCRISFLFEINFLFDFLNMYGNKYKRNFRSDCFLELIRRD